eukprot:8508607-Prorocentrum_lima.AAC.1
MKGGFLLLNAWLIPSQGISAANSELLAIIMRLVKAVSKPWMLVGDFNLPPEMLNAAAVDKGLHPVVVST